MRLKKLFVILFFALGFALFPKRALAQTFLTYEQFQSLNTVHQIEYIGDLQKLVVELSANASLVTGEEPTQAYLFQKFFSNVLPSAEAQIDRLAYRNQQCRLRSASHLSKTALYSNIENVRNCTEISVNGSPKYYLPAVAERLVVLTGEIKTRLENGKLSRKERRVGEVIGTLKATIQGFNEVGTSDGKNYQAYIRKATQNLASIGTVTKKASPPPAVSKPAMQTSDRPFRSAPPTVSASKPASAPSRPPSGATAKPTQAATPAVAPGKEKSTATNAASSGSAPAADAASSGSEFPYQCMYAGFVIPKNPKNSCQPLKKLPASFAGDFFDAEQFICSKVDEILCNPLIFGYEPNCGTEVDTSCKAKKPLCTVRAQNATQNCFELSQQKMTRPQVLKIWQSPGGQKSYQSFIQSLLQLCDSENLKKRNLREAVFVDITQTCEVAFKAMDQNLKDKFLPSLGPLEKRLKEGRAQSTD